VLLDDTTCQTVGGGMIGSMYSFRVYTTRDGGKVEISISLTRQVRARRYRTSDWLVCKESITPDLAGIRRIVEGVETTDEALTALGCLA